eukprot:TRINITY_DN47284_c0_g1_i1.p1 TRINITY_DN47284_c0_g1~~TRINITY_DN47284_c0_g1_i1.p1  ORF type:complete len:174 (+),score=28.89 TRINITY_DN47284_c0_g1_i1:153-674(+)
MAACAKSWAGATACEASYVEQTHGVAPPAQGGEVDLASHVLFQVATADDDIHEVIVQDAVSFAKARLQAAYGTLMMTFEKPANRQREARGDEIMSLKKELFDLRMVLAGQIESGAKLPDCGEVGELTKAKRRKLTKKLSEAEKVLGAISSAIWMRSYGKRDFAACAVSSCRLS